MINDDTVRAVNELTARWVGALPGQGTVLTAAGVWPLLAFLAHGAGGAAREELSDALGVPADAAAGQGRALLSALGDVPGLAAALGLWTSGRLRVEPGWLDALPPHVHELLSGDAARDQERLDAWAARSTDGRIGSMPVAVDSGTPLVLAGALTLRTDWTQPFGPGVMRPADGPWQGRTLAALYRSTGRLDQVEVAETPFGPVTVVRVTGGEGVDVHLLLGTPDAPAARVLRAGVLRAGVPALGRGSAVVPGDRPVPGEPGPGLTVERVPSIDGEPALRVATVPFTVRADHDLLYHRGVFGLASATDASRGHFPGISPDPLAVGRAAQSVTASFGARGFHSAAVTAFMAAPSGVPRYRYRALEIRARFDRPFGFLAVHRASGLVLNAGWVTDPDPPA